MLLLRSGAGLIPVGGRMLRDAGSAHLTVQAIDETQQLIRLRLQEILPDGAFEEVLQASARPPVFFPGIKPGLTLGSHWGQV